MAETRIEIREGVEYTVTVLPEATPRKGRGKTTIRSKKAARAAGVAKTQAGSYGSSVNDLIQQKIMSRSRNKKRRKK